VELRRGADPGELPRNVGTRIRGRRRLHRRTRRRRGGFPFPCRPEAPEEPQRRDAGHRPDVRQAAPAVQPGRADRAAAAGRRRQAPERLAPALGIGGCEPRSKSGRGWVVSEANGSTIGRRTTKRRSALRFELLNAFVDGGMADLSRAELAVWLILY